MERLFDLDIASVSGFGQLLYEVTPKLALRDRQSGQRSGICF